MKVSKRKAIYLKRRKPRPINNLIYNWCPSPVKQRRFLHTLGQKVGHTIFAIVEPWSTEWNAVCLKRLLLVLMTWNIGTIVLNTKYSRSRNVNETVMDNMNTIKKEKQKLYCISQRRWIKNNLPITGLLKQTDRIHIPCMMLIIKHVYVNDYCNLQKRLHGISEIWY